MTNGAANGTNRHDDGNVHHWVDTGHRIVPGNNVHHYRCYARQTVPCAFANANTSAAAGNAYRLRAHSAGAAGGGTSHAGRRSLRIPSGRALIGNVRSHGSNAAGAGGAHSHGLKF